MKKENIIKIFLVIAIIISSYLVYLHYIPEKLNSSFCNLNDYLSCATVNKSPYALFFSIPVSIIGVTGLTLMLIILLMKPKYYPVYIILMNTTAIIFMLYLTYAEFFIIKSLCLLCLTVTAIVIIIYKLSLIEYGNYFIKFIKDIKIE